MKASFQTLILTLLITSVAQSARADFTAFFVPDRKPIGEMTRGVALGISLLVIGFEFEYSESPKTKIRNTPSIRSGMFNILVQTPISVSGLRFYGTIGGGVFRETLNVQTKTNIGTNLGGGIKIQLPGPIGARVDYRVFSLRHSLRKELLQRLYIGLNLGF